MRLSSLFLRSLGFLSLLASVVCSPVDLGSLFDTDSMQSPDQPDPQSPPAETVEFSAAPVVAHFLVGVTIQYEVHDWEEQIRQAAATGFDGFSLNVGQDEWQQGQVQHAFKAAEDSDHDFKLFMSFDMSAIPCSSANDADLLRSYINDCGSSPSYMHFRGKPFVTAFSGQNCTFGQANPDEGWRFALKQPSFKPVNFVPSFFLNDPASLSQFTSIDGGFNWNSGWPMDSGNVSFGPDQDWIDHLNGSIYMAAVSPWFFTHYGPDSYNKNFVYRMDDCMVVKRWDVLQKHREQVDIVQAVSWNDFGESHYLGPLLAHDTQPNSQAWVDGYDHHGWLDLFAYLIQRYKTGSYPQTPDKVILWTRPYAAQATAPNDPVGPPAHREWLRDAVWGYVILERPASVTLECGPTKRTWPDLPAGPSTLSLALTSDCSVRVSVERGDDSNRSFSRTGLEFSTNPPTYNYNVRVWSSLDAV